MPEADTLPDVAPAANRGPDTPCDWPGCTRSNTGGHVLWRVNTKGQSGIWMCLDDANEYTRRSSRRTLAHLGVSCDATVDDPDDDECATRLTGDYVVQTGDTTGTRLGYALDAATSAGWRVLGRDHPETALAFCPAHTAQADAIDGAPR